MEVLEYIVELNSSVAIAIIMMVMGLLVGAKVSKALQAGLTVGIAFTGLNLVIGLLMDSLGPAVEAMVTRLGIELTIIDVGWPATATISYASKIGALVIPLCLVINIVMLVTKTTQTLNVDLWNYWHLAFTGALVANLTTSLAWGLIASGLNAVIILVMADLTAKQVEKYNDLPGVSIANGFSTAYVPLALFLNKILDRIPKIRDIEIDPEVLKQKFGFFGKPMFIGTSFGILIGVAAGYEVKNILNLGIKMGAVLALIPRMAAMLGEGLVPITEAAQNLMKEHFGNRKRIFIGIDPSAIIGHSTTMSVALVLVPITIGLAIILPGNKVLPFADLAVLPYMLCLVSMVTEENVFRTFIIGLISVAIGLLVATNLAPLFTQLVKESNFGMPQGATMVTSIDDGGNPLIWIIVRLMERREIGLGIVGTISIVIALYNRRRISRKSFRGENNHKENEQSI